MFRIYNHRAIEEHGGFLYGDDNFQLVACNECLCQYLYNHEVGELFFDPNDLSRIIHDFEGEDKPACRCCGKKDWEVCNLNGNDLPEVRNGEWAWVLDDEAISSQRMVDAAERTLSGLYGVIEGSCVLAAFGTQTELYGEQDFAIFLRVYSACKDLLVTYCWSEEMRLEKERKLDCYEEQFRDEVLVSCKKLIDRLA